MQDVKAVPEQSWSRQKRLYIRVVCGKVIPISKRAKESANPLKRSWPQHMKSTAPIAKGIKHIWMAVYNYIRAICMVFVGDVIAISGKSRVPWGGRYIDPHASAWAFTRHEHQKMQLIFSRKSWSDALIKGLRSCMWKRALFTPVKAVRSMSTKRHQNLQKLCDVF